MWTIASLFTHEGIRYRARAFLKVQHYAIKGDDSFARFFRAKYKEAGQDPDHLKRFVFCPAEEASVVCGINTTPDGPNECYVPIKCVVPDGAVEWPQKKLEDYTRTEQDRYGEREYGMRLDIIDRLIAEVS